jgi:hypothetical protein
MEGTALICLNESTHLKGPPHYSSVCELMGWVRNVILIKCIFGSGKPWGGRDFGWEGTRAR